MKYSRGDTLVLKILVVGESSVGKTSLVQRYAHGDFSTTYKATIGVDFSTKVIEWKDGMHICLQFWDLAGQDRLNNQIKIYYREAAGALCVCDVTRPESREKVLLWKDLVKCNSTRRDGSHHEPPCVLVVNKVDLLGSASFSKDAFAVSVPLAEIPVENPVEDQNFQFSQMAIRAGFHDGFGASAKTGLGISDAVYALVDSIMQDPHYRIQNVHDDDIVQLGNSETGSASSDLFMDTPAQRSWKTGWGWC